VIRAAAALATRRVTASMTRALAALVVRAVTAVMTRGPVAHMTSAVVVVTRAPATHVTSAVAAVWTRAPAAPATRAAAALAVVCAVAALAACGGDDSPTARTTPTATPEPDGGGVLAARDAADRGRMRIGPTSRFDVAQGVAVPVRVPRGARRVDATLAVGDGAPTRLSSPVRLHRTGKRRLTLPVRAAAAHTLADCVPARLTVAARDRRGRAVARRTVELPPTAPDCARFFGTAAVWNRPLPADAPLDPLSSTLVEDLKRQVQAGFDKRFPPTINTTSYSTPVYTVPAGQERVPVRLTRGQDYGHSLQKVLQAGVPIPDDARPAAGGDAHIVVWQPATDTMWELWTAKQVDGRWQAGWGGRMEHVSRSRGYFSDPWGIHPGATASSLPLAGGLITLRDLQRGEIDHALAMALPSNRSGVWALPAQRTDGNARRPDAIPQGARFRLDPNVDVDALGLPPFTAMLARAAQRYGIIVRDTSAVVTLYGEDPTPLGENPWAAALEPSASEVLRAFPWDRLQVMQMDLRTYGNKRVER